MKALLLAALLICVSIEVIDAALTESSLKEQLLMYQRRVQAATDLLARECPNSAARSRRQLSGHVSELDVKLEKALYDQLRKKLEDCTKSQTTPAAQTTKPPPVECQNAKNLTESWRLDSHISGRKPGGRHSKYGYACDFNSGDASTWFRFTGAAGSRLLNKCPNMNGCGTRVAFWSDRTVPKVIGKEVKLAAYGVWRNPNNPGSSCYGKTVSIRAMWCSDNDIIYKPITGLEPGSCDSAFCGMA